MQKNVASQKLIVFAFDSTTNLAKTGDAANITAYVSKDYGSVTVLGDTSATEMDATNAKGYYLFDLTQAETNGDTLLFSAKSSTSNIVVVGVPATVFTTPANFDLLSVDGSGRVDVGKALGTAVTLDANNVLNVSAKYWAGTAITATSIPVATAAGATGGLFIAGTNAATTISGLTTGALICTTITASGAVAFQSTFAVTTSTSLGALSCTTLTASGAVAFQSTFAVTTSTSLGAVSGSTLTLSGAVAFQSTFAVTGTTTLAAFTATGTMTVNAFTCTNAFTVSGNFLVTGTTTHTGAFTASNASNNIVGIDVAKAAGTAWASGAITAASIAATALNGKGDWLLASSYTAPPTAAAVTTAVWTDLLAGSDFSTAASVGKLLKDNVTANLATMTAAYAAGTFAVDSVNQSVFVAGGTIDTYTGNTPQTGDAYARIGATGSGLTSLAPAATALSTAVWTGAKAAFLTGDVQALTAGERNSVAAALLATALTQHNASALTTSTVEDALSAARAQGAGAWSISGTTLTLKNPDGTTFRSFTLDSSSAPTSRT